MNTKNELPMHEMYELLEILLKVPDSPQRRETDEQTESVFPRMDTIN